MKVAIASGARFHAQHLARQLVKRDALAKLYTWSYHKQDQLFLPNDVVCHDWRGTIVDACYHRLYLSRFVSRSYWHVLKDNRFDRWLSKQMKDAPAFDIFVGWAHYVLQTLPLIRARGAKIVLEMGSTHILTQQQILSSEFKKWGASSIPLHERNIAKMLEEYEYADYIMTPSSFARNSFIAQGVAPKKIGCAAYGVDTSFFTPNYNHKKKFIVLFVGALSFCKGIPYLLKAWQQLSLPEKESELVLVGQLRPEVREYLFRVDLKANITFAGAVSPEQLRAMYRRASVFVLPSVQEGLAMVIAQAMASGLPVICTPNTGGEEFVADAQEGFIVPIQDSQSLMERIAYYFENREICRRMGMRARDKIEAYTWDRYGKQVVSEYAKL